MLEVFQEVNDAVVAYRNMRRTAELKYNLREAARQYVVLAKLQYINGVIRYIDVLDAQRKFFDAQIEESNAVRNEHLALVELYKALGGGWNVDRTAFREQAAAAADDAATAAEPSGRE